MSPCWLEVGEDIFKAPWCYGAVVWKPEEDMDAATLGTASHVAQILQRSWGDPMHTRVKGSCHPSSYSWVPWARGTAVVGTQIDR